MLYQVFGGVAARTRQFVPFVQGARSHSVKELYIRLWANVPQIVFSLNLVPEVFIFLNKGP